MAFASGMGALTTTVLALCSSGDHIVATRQLYAGTLAFLQGPCQRFGIEVTLVDGTLPGAMAAAVQPGRTTMVIAESPSNPRLELVDLDELGSIMGPFTVLDSTFATPLGQQPLAHGVDIVVHSATKGIAGHNDATIGVVAAERELVDAIWAYGVLHGAMASPFDALNALRGIRTHGGPHRAPGRRRRSGWASGWSSIRPCRRCATPASHRTRSTTSPSARCASSAPSSRSSSPAGAMRPSNCSTGWNWCGAPRRSAAPRR